MSCVVSSSNMLKCNEDDASVNNALMISDNCSCESLLGEPLSDLSVGTHCKLELCPSVLVDLRFSVNQCCLITVPVYLTVSQYTPSAPPA